MDYKTVMLVHLQSFVIITIIVMSLWPSTTCISYSFVIHKKKQDLTFPIKLYNTIFNVVIQQQRGVLYFEARGKT